MNVKFYLVILILGYLFYNSTCIYCIYLFRYFNIDQTSVADIVCKEEVFDETGCLHSTSNWLYQCNQVQCS